MQKKTNHLVSIVDDDKSVREATASLVKANGFKTECFSSAPEFLNSTHANEIGCLILDLQMQGMSGLELQRQLAVENRRIPIIFITAHGSPENLEQAMQAGAVEFLPKPFSEEALLGAIQKALGP